MFYDYLKQKKRYLSIFLNTFPLVFISIYSWPLNNMGLNYVDISASTYTWIFFFPVVNTTVLHSLGLVELVDAVQLQSYVSIWIFDFAEGQRS